MGDKMNKIVYQRFGKKYRKIDRNETIAPGAMQSWCLGELEPIIGADIIGDKPSNFSDERDFYNPIEDASETPIKIDDEECCCLNSQYYPIRNGRCSFCGGKYSNTPSSTT